MFGIIISFVRPFGATDQFEDILSIKNYFILKIIPYSLLEIFKFKGSTMCMEPLVKEHQATLYLLFLLVISNLM